MNKRALLIGPEEREAIARLIAHAEAHPLSRARLVATVELDAPPVGNDPAHVVAIPIGYRCAFSYEGNNCFDSSRHHWQYGEQR